MILNLSNEEYNYVRKRLMRLEETYNQTIDPMVRNLVKDQTCCELFERVPAFYDLFGKKIENCKMSSLKEIVDLTTEIMGSLTVDKLEEIDMQNAKKILKLKQKHLSLFVKAYNDAIRQENMTYFSMQIDNKFIMMTYHDGDFYGTVSDFPKDAKCKKSLCCFCNSFREGRETAFVTNTQKKDNGEYSTVGQYCCSDYQQCNKDITDSDKLIEFLSYSKKYSKIRSNT